MNKYLVDGREVDVLAELPDGRFLVACVYGGDEECYVAEDAPFITGRVFDQPPMEKLNAEVKRLNDEIERLGKKRLEVAAEINRMAVNENPAVTQLRNLLDGRYTHLLLVNDRGIEIIEVDKIDKNDNGNQTILLIGPLKYGKMNWAIYHRDYRSWVHFCTSRAEALQLAQNHIDEMARRSIREINGNIVKFALDNGLTVPPEALKSDLEDRKRSIQSDLNFNAKLAREYQERAEAYRKKLTELEAA